MKLEFKDLPPRADDRTYSTKIVLEESGTHIYFFQGPTYNCQFSSIGRMECVLDQGPKESKDILKQLWSLYKIPMFLVDVHNYDRYHTAILEVFGKENIVFRQDYTSTNQSKMSMYLLKTNKLQNLIEIPKVEPVINIPIIPENPVFTI